MLFATFLPKMQKMKVALITIEIQFLMEKTKLIIIKQTSLKMGFSYVMYFMTFLEYIDKNI